jgi:hypothetical protein
MTPVNQTREYQLRSAGVVSVIALTVRQSMNLAVPTAMKSSLLLKPVAGMHRRSSGRHSLNMPAGLCYGVQLICVTCASPG